MKRWVHVSERCLCMIPTFVCLLQEAFEQCGHVLETWQSSVVCHTAYEEIYQSNASNVSTRNRQYVNNAHDTLHMKALVWGLVTMTIQVSCFQNTEGGKFSLKHNRHTTRRGFTLVWWFTSASLLRSSSTIWSWPFLLAIHNAVRPVCRSKKDQRLTTIPPTSLYSATSH